MNQYLNNNSLDRKPSIHNYLIAGLKLEISLYQTWDIDKVLSNFLPFKITEEISAELSCKIVVGNNRFDVPKAESKLLSDISIVWGDRFTFWESADYYWTVVEGDRIEDELWVMRSTKDFKMNDIQVGNENIDFSNLLSWFCMVGFAQSGLLFKSILFHSSVVMNEDGAYGFLGKSGTGKSTHSRLWLRHIPGHSLLNDDNPAVRIMPNGEVRVFGTPWSGKTPCYKNDSRLLHGFVRLSQAPFNAFERKKNKDALIALLPSCSAIRWNGALYSVLVDLLVELIISVPVGALNCLPNKEASELCHKELLNCKLLV